MLPRDGPEPGGPSSDRTSTRVTRAGDGAGGGGGACEGGPLPRSLRFPLSIMATRRDVEDVWGHLLGHPAASEP